MVLFEEDCSIENITIMKNIYLTLWSIWAIFIVLCKKALFKHHATIYSSITNIGYARGFNIEMLSFSSYSIRVRAKGAVYCIHTKSSLYNHVEVMFLHKENLIKTL